MNEAVLTLLFSLFAPLFLIPVEKLFPYPYFIEEAVKFGLVLILKRAEERTRKNLFWWVVIAGLLFTFSESVFYLTNIFALGNLSLFFQRLALTGIMHLGTILLLYFFAKAGRYFQLIGLFLAIVIHFAYNYWMGSSIYW